MLTPCAHCRRHVSITEVCCPFCRHALPGATPRAVVAGRMSRAAVFVGASLAAASCHHAGVSPSDSQREASLAVGTITGVVRWEGANVVGGYQSGIRQGVTVVLVDEDDKVRQSVKTDDRGEYRFVHVPNGIYTVKLKTEDGMDSRTSAAIVAVEDATIHNADLLSHLALPYGAPPARRRTV